MLIRGAAQLFKRQKALGGRALNSAQMLFFYFFFVNERLPSEALPGGVALTVGLIIESVM